MSGLNYTKKLLALYFFVLSAAISCKTIIWDIGDTLFTTSKFGMAYHVGLSSFLEYMIFDLKNPNVQPIIFDILEKIDPDDEKKYSVATDSSGKSLPKVMHDWLAGNISHQELITSVNDYIEKLDKQNYFVSSREKRLVKKTIDVMFTPEILAKYTTPLMQGINLLKECSAVKNKNGTLKNKLMILSNWDPISFDLVKLKYPEIFKYFYAHHIIISGAIGLIKPHKAAFEYVLKTYNLDPNDCIFIDDQIVNVSAAIACGITGLLLCNSNYEFLRKQLVSLGAL